MREYCLGLTHFDIKFYDQTQTQPCTGETNHGQLQSETWVYECQSDDPGDQGLEDNDTVRQ